MFDPDCSMEMDRKEMSKFFWASLNSICKVANLPSPRALSFQEFIVICFKEIDEDGGNSVDFDEFKNWLCCNAVI